ncbi:SCP2 sterol-binding domain-containing protein [Longirhabdus pacifica]|uniref:SCP2 sterol-binding domain-containing protein n=1 Tax=Longirhabdus pacifica TaxID=2305227 RepID=UPI0010092BC2|nr:SCP2 sterol-binding domain-containing protein [Longirhabdus pacifica]
MAIMDVLQDLAAKINADPEGIEDVESTFQFDLTSGTYQIRFHDGKVEFQQADDWEAKCTLKLSDDNFMKLLEGSLNPASAFMMGKLKVEGQMGHAMKLQTILKHYKS